SLRLRWTCWRGAVGEVEQGRPIRQVGIYATAAAFEGSPGSGRRVSRPRVARFKCLPGQALAARPPRRVERVAADVGPQALARGRPVSRPLPLQKAALLAPVPGPRPTVPRGPARPEWRAPRRLPPGPDGHIPERGGLCDRPCRWG